MSEERFGMLNLLKRRGVARSTKMMAAQGQLAVSATERQAILELLARDEDGAIRALAAATLGRRPPAPIEALQPVSDMPPAGPESAVTELTVGVPSSPPAPDPPFASASLDGATVCEQCAGATEGDPAAVDESSWIDHDPMLQSDDGVSREGIVHRLAKMNFSERLKAAMKGSREVRAILIRDPSKLIAGAVLKSPRLTEPEVESFARLGNVTEDVLRAIGNNRAWMKNYGVVLALTKNAKTPLAISLNLLNRLNDRDVTQLSSDRNVPEPLRVAARKRVVSAVSRR